MKNRWYFLPVICIGMICLHCPSKNPTDSETPKVFIKNVWFTNVVDTDHDGYSSYARLNFNLDTNVGQFRVAVKIGVRNHTGNAAQPYNTYFESSAFIIEGETTEDAVYLEIGNPNTELTEGDYDLLLQVFAADNLTEVIAEASPTTHPVLNNVKFEKASQEKSEKWLSNNDDGLFEGFYQHNPRLGFSYTRLAEKFVKPLDVTSSNIKKVRIHIPTIYNTPAQATFSIYNDSSNEPKDILYTSTAFDINATGWNEFNLSFDITNYRTFYLAVHTSTFYAVSTDSNSTSLNGYRRFYITSNPPREGWEKHNCNYAIDAFIEY
ncbi:choice-of-anchor H family protein [candidate division KSB1 bacterium]|nr:choice-of-anchor H family protein [candidate division KSB1 bacterium]